MGHDNMVDPTNTTDGSILGPYCAVCKCNADHSTRCRDCHAEVGHVHAPDCRLKHDPPPPAKEAMVKVLIIYENIPESTDLYLVSVKEELFQKIRCCNNLLVNVTGQTSEEDELALWLYEWLQSHQDHKMPKEVELFVEGAWVIRAGFMM